MSILCSQPLYDDDEDNSTSLPEENASETNESVLANESNSSNKSSRVIDLSNSGSNALDFCVETSPSSSDESEEAKTIEKITSNFFSRQ